MDMPMVLPARGKTHGFLRRNWHRFTLAAIVLLSFFLNFYEISQLGYGNAYYAAAIKSMTQSWHNFFYASFDPAGIVSVDKPPLGLWVQVLFVMIFGYHGWAMLLPQALSGAASSAMMYVLTAKRFGKPAGLISALVFALTPAVVVASRNNTMDMQLILVLLIAAWFLFRSIETGKWRYLFLCAVMIGLGFNIKMLQAYMILPAVVLVYLLCAKEKLGRRFLAGVISVIILAAVSFSWAAAVDLTPASNRPYVGSSTNNTEWELILGHNGMERIGGMGGFFRGTRGGRMGGPMNGNGDGFRNRPDGFRRDGQNTPDGSNQQNTQDNKIQTDNSSNWNGQNNMTPPDGTSNQNGQNNMSPPDNSNNQNEQDNMAPPDGFNNQNRQGNIVPPDNFNNQNGQDNMIPPDGFHPEGMPRFGNRNGDGGPGMMGMGANGGGAVGNDIGTAGITRLWQQSMYGQASWLLIPAFFCILACARRPRKGQKLTTKQGIFLFWVVWLVVIAVFFSFASFYHRYYLCMLAPGIAGVIGIGFPEMFRQFRMRKGWRQWLLPLAVLTGSGFSAWYVWVYYSELRATLFPILLGFGAAALIAMAVYLLRPKKAIALAAAGLMAVSQLSGSFYWALTSTLYVCENVTMPYAGPELKSTQNTPGMTPNQEAFVENDSATQSLEDYLVKNYKEGSYLVVAQRANDVAQFIVDTGLPAVAYGGFLGTDNALTLAQLKQLVKEGKITYFLVSSEGGMGGSSDIISYVKENATKIDASEYGGSSGRGTLYRFDSSSISE
jgi:4-amino-4-deoxy-L-arabinose transferase-like glycosyltransferase